MNAKSYLLSKVERRHASDTNLQFRSRAPPELNGLKLQIAALLLLSAWAGFSQTPVSAGGRWVRIQKMDPQTGAQIVTFALEAEANIYDRHPVISLTCSDRLKAPEVLFFADAILDPQIHDPFNYYADALYAVVKIDQHKLYKAVWDIQGGNSPRLTKTAFIDHKTTKQLLKGTEMKVRFQAHLGQEFIDSFAIGGLDKEMVRDACGNKWFGKD